MAVRSFAATGFVVNANVIYPGLTTVAVPMLRPSDGTLFALNCTALSAALSANKIRREIGPAMKETAKRLAMALPASAHVTV